MPGGKRYSRKELRQIVTLYNEGKNAKQISEILGRSYQGTMYIVRTLKKKKKVICPKAKNMLSDEPKTLADFSYEEIIKYLYAQGFRIKDNTLVHVTETPVKLENLI